MKTFLIGFLLLSATFCSFFRKEHLNQEKTLELTKNASFQTYSYEENPFKGFSTEEIQRMLGAKGLDMSSNLTFENNDLSDLPTEFDSRKAWPSCVHPIRDQQKCGSCWAFGATEVLSDRYCIATEGSENIILSPQDLVECDFTNHGCNGGNLALAWTFLRYFGAVEEKCKPYVSGDGHVPHCRKHCEDESVQYQKHHSKTIGAIGKTERAIKEEIQKNGPVEGGFIVYEDFMSYKSGVYEHKTGGMLGGHAIKIIGWGEENGTRYWLCANSWSPKWGEEGFFKIKVGECQIEANVFAGEAEKDI